MTAPVPFQGGRSLHDLHDFQALPPSAKGYADALMLDWQGRVAECTGANVFFTRDGAIHTHGLRIASSTALPAAR